MRFGHLICNANKNGAREKGERERRRMRGEGKASSSPPRPPRLHGPPRVRFERERGGRERKGGMGMR